MTKLRYSSFVIDWSFVLGHSSFIWSFIWLPSPWRCRIIVRYEKYFRKFPYQPPPIHWLGGRRGGGHRHADIYSRQCPGPRGPTRSLGTDRRGHFWLGHDGPGEYRRIDAIEGLPGCRLLQYR